MKFLRIIYIMFFSALACGKLYGQCMTVAPLSQGKCGGGIFNITVNTYPNGSCTTYPSLSSVSFNWYTGPTGGTPTMTMAATQNPSTGVYTVSYSVNLIATQTYWVSVAYGTTESSRSQINLIVDNPLTLSTISPDPNNRCGAGPLTIQINGPYNASYSWYANSTTTTTLATTAMPSWQNPNVTATTTYYVSAQSNVSGGCPPSSRIPVTATINPPPAPPSTVQNQYRFGTGTVQLSASGNPAGSSVQWFASASGGTALSTGSSYTTGSLTNTTTYYVGSSTGPNCVSNARTPVTAYVYPFPSIVASGPLYSNNCSVQLSLNATYNSYQWKNSKGTVISANATIAVYQQDVYSVTVTIGNPPGIPSTATYTLNSGYNSSALPLNYIVSKTVNADNVKDECTLNSLPATSVQTSIKFFDGMSRPIQQVDYQASPGQKDIVQPIDYDAAGRQPKQYLPYSAATADGNYKPDWTTAQAAFYNNSANNNADRVVNDLNPFQISVFDNSPLNLTKQILPEGAAWQAESGHGIQTILRTNTANEVRNWIYSTSGTANGSTFYPAGNLRVIQNLDEDNNPVWEYRDVNNKVVLKKRQDVVTLAFLETYYVFDDFGDLRFVIPPQAMKLFNPPSAPYIVDYASTFSNQWIHSYKYDSRRRVAEKKIPGSASVFYVYDNKNRLVLSQDGNQRDRNQWSFIKYDVNNRQIIKGIYNHSSSLAQSLMQATYNQNNPNVIDESRLSSSTHGYSNVVWPTNPSFCSIQIVNYYDDYDFNNDKISDYTYSVQGLSGEAATNNFVQNLATGSKVLTLDSLNPKWLWSVNFYDKFNRVVQLQKNNHINAVVAPLPDIQTTVYDFIGKPLQIYKTNNAGNGVLKFSIRFSYDQLHRLINTWQKTNTDPEVLLSQIKYNELGQTVEKNLHSENNGTTFLQSVDYNYNIRGWLTYINNSSLTNDGIINNDANDKFGLKLGYEVSEYGSVPRYNGTITSQRWKGTSAETINRYFYNGTNALQKADHGIWNGSTFISDQSFLEDSINYDLNGNITNLYRTGESNGALDRLKYAYDGNQLFNVSDFADTLNGFINVTRNGREYSYDKNGNLTSDLNKGISIYYNYLNLPSTIIFANGNKIQYLYDATGTKLQKITTYPGNQNKFTWDYSGPFVYYNSSIYYIANGEGRAQANGSSFNYYYDLKDHLGSVRITFDKDPVTGLASSNEENHYYAYGMRIQSSQFLGTPSNQSYIQYNGKEVQSDSKLNWYDYGARMYDGTLGRWHVIDPLAEKSRRFSPYSYCYSNPIRFTDPDGMIPSEPLPNLAPLVSAPMDPQSLGEMGKLHLFGFAYYEYIEQTNGNKGGQNSAGGTNSSQQKTGGDPKKPSNSNNKPAPAPDLGPSPCVDCPPATTAAVPVAVVISASDGPIPIGEVIGAAIVSGAIAADLKTRVYVTYTKLGPNGQIYVGRTSGWGTPDQIVRVRDYGHHMNFLGYGPAKPDKSAIGWPDGYSAIRGREQQLIDYYGGVGSPNVGNSIRGVGYYNLAGPYFHLMSNEEFGNIAPYTGF